MRFYGISYTDLGRMSARRRTKLWLAIDVLEAQETLTLIKATTYAKLKDNDRRSFDSKLKSRAYPEYLYSNGEPAKDLKNSLLFKLRKVK